MQAESWWWWWSIYASNPGHNELSLRSNKSCQPLTQGSNLVCKAHLPGQGTSPQDSAEQFTVTDSFL